MISINLSNIAILNIKGSDYHCIISLISKTEAIELLQSADLTEKSGTLENIKHLVTLKLKNKFYHHKAPTFWEM